MSGYLETRPNINFVYFFIHSLLVWAVNCSCPVFVWLFAKLGWFVFL
jgi:hypothetical protein